MLSKNSPKKKPGTRAPKTAHKRSRKSPSRSLRHSVLPTTSSDIPMPDINPPKK